MADVTRVSAPTASTVQRFVVLLRRSLRSLLPHVLLAVLAIVFLVPVVLVAAELASGWNGGVFGWVRAAYGDRLGFLAIWQQ